LRTAVVRRHAGLQASAVRRMLLGKQRIPVRVGRPDVEASGTPVSRTSEDLTAAPQQSELSPDAPLVKLHVSTLALMLHGAIRLHIGSLM
jgi:hypothetical protein